MLVEDIRPYKYRGQYAIKGYVTLYSPKTKCFPAKLAEFVTSDLFDWC